MAKRPRRSGSLNFDLISPIYDLGLWFLGLFIGGEKRLRLGVIEEAMPLEGVRVLELFAGTGTLALMASERGARCEALDLSAGMLRVASVKAARAGARLGLVTGDSSELPFCSETFDRVIVSLGMHEVPVPVMEAAVRESARVLKKGGRLIILDFHRAEGFTGLLQKILFLFVEGEEARAWVRVDIQGLLKSEGFRGFNRRFLLRRSLQLITVERA